MPVRVWWQRLRARRGSATMVRSAIPILPSGDLRVSEAFYAGLGFEAAARYDGYLVTHQGPVELHITADNLTSDRSADPGKDHSRESTAAATCFVHVWDATAYWKQLAERGVAGLSTPQEQDYGLVEFTAVDPYGNRLRFGSPVR